MQIPPPEKDSVSADTVWCLPMDHKGPGLRNNCSKNAIATRCPMKEEKEGSIPALVSILPLIDLHLKVATS